jgi:hypothetical protein
MDDLEKIQGCGLLKTFEKSVILTPVAAITNIAVSILKMLGSVILLAQGRSDKTCFKSAIKLFFWGVATLTPVFGGAITISYMRYKNEQQRNET